MNLPIDIYQLIIDKLYIYQYLKFKRISKYHYNLGLKVDWSEQFTNNEYFDLYASLIKTGDYENFCNNVHCVPKYISNVSNLLYGQSFNLMLLPSLTKLTFDENSQQSFSLKNLTGLKSLELNGAWVNFYYDLPNLESLKIISRSHPFLDNFNVKLKSLTLFDVRLPERLTLPNLTFLELRRSPNKLYLDNLTNLAELNCFDTKIRSLPNSLAALSLIYNDDIDLSNLIKLTSLTLIEVNYDQVAHLINLVSLNLTSCDEDLSKLIKLTNFGCHQHLNKFPPNLRTLHCVNELIFVNNLERLIITDYALVKMKDDQRIAKLFDQYAQCQGLILYKPKHDYLEHLTKEPIVIEHNEVPMLYF